MLSLRFSQLLNRPRKLLWNDQTMPCMCLRCSLAYYCVCPVFARVFHVFLWADETSVCSKQKPYLPLLPFAACATLTIHVICMCVLAMHLCVLSAACVLSLV